MSETSKTASTGTRFASSGRHPAMALVTRQFSAPTALALLVLVTGLSCLGQAHATGDAVAGKSVFANQCASCHTIEVGKNGFGPSLAGVYLRKAGTLPGYNYSPAMPQSGLT